MSVFQDCSFFCGGLPDGDRDRLEGLIHAYGGAVAEVLTDGVTYVVDSHLQGTGAQLAKRRKHKAQLVNPLFVSACITEGALVAASKHKLTSKVWVVTLVSVLHNLLEGCQRCPCFGCCCSNCEKAVKRRRGLVHG